MASFTSERKDCAKPFAILSRIARADKSAAQECIDRYSNMIWALAKQFTNSITDAEKVVPEIFMDIWQNAAFCDLEISDESVWIVLIARRRLSQYALESNYQLLAKFAENISAEKSDEIQKPMLAA